MTTDNENTETPESDEGQSSFFARGALLGLVGGAVVALLAISVVGTVVSLVDDVFGSSSAAVADAGPQNTDPAVAAGESLASSAGCTACHSSNGVDGLGPTWKGLGETADADYLTRAIVDPNADLADGFEADVMLQTYGDTLSETDIAALVAYIQSL